MMFFQWRQVLTNLTLATLVLGGQVLGLATRRDESPEHKLKRSFIERDGVKRTIVEDESTGSKLDFVTNSGICETTPGVNQYSGYFSVGCKSQSYQELPQLMTYTYMDSSKREYVVLVLRSTKCTDHSTPRTVAQWRAGVLFNDWSFPSTSCPPRLIYRNS